MCSSLLVFQQNDLHSHWLLFFIYIIYYFQFGSGWPSPCVFLNMMCSMVLKRFLMKLCFSRSLFHAECHKHLSSAVKNCEAKIQWWRDVIIRVKRYLLHSHGLFHWRTMTVCGCRDLCGMWTGQNMATDFYVTPENVAPLRPPCRVKGHVVGPAGHWKL